MALKITIDSASELRNQFVAYNRNNYSFKGYEAILELFEDSETDTELDVIAICCDYTENDKDTIIQEYSISEALNKESAAEITNDEVLEYLNARTWAVQLEDNLFLYQVF